MQYIHHNTIAELLTHSLQSPTTEPLSENRRDEYLSFSSGSYASESDSEEGT